MAAKPTCEHCRHWRGMQRELGYDKYRGFCSKLGEYGDGVPIIIVNLNERAVSDRPDSTGMRLIAKPYRPEQVSNNGSQFLLATQSDFACSMFDREATA